MSAVDLAYKPVTPNILSHQRDQDDMGWVTSARSFPGRVMDALGGKRFPLFVIAEDKVKPAQGFGLHGHRDMEIMSYVVSGALRHADSRGNDQVLRSGEVQMMTAGRGIQHSEFNASSSEPVHFLQIWVHPDQGGLEPGYSLAAFDPAEPKTLLAGPADGLIRINQAMEIWRVAPGATDIAFEQRSGSRGWAHVVKGSMDIDGMALAAGDGISITGTSKLNISAHSPGAEMLLFVEIPATQKRSTP